MFRTVCAFQEQTVLSKHGLAHSPTFALQDNNFMKYDKAINLFLGVSMFMFGFLKFFSPFKGWYSVQISASELGNTSYVLGIAGELVVGLTLLALVRFRQKIPFEIYAPLVALASAGVIVIMCVATYVHLNPGVPAEVLPLKIKPPFIPLFFISVSVFQIILAGKQYRLSKSRVL